MLKAGTKADVVDLLLGCTYEGLRQRSGTSEALVSFTGRVQGRNNRKDKVDGRVVGQFGFDTERGFIASAKVTIATEASSLGSAIEAVGAFEIDLQRVEGNPKKIQLAPQTAATPAPVKGDVIVQKPGLPAPQSPPTPALPGKGSFNQPAKSDTSQSYLKIISSPGDYIGQGKTYEYMGDQLVLKRTPRGLHLMVDGWILDIGAPNGQSLQVGEYLNAKRFAFSAGSPGLDFFGKGRGSNRLAGEFVVWELQMEGAQIKRLAIDFVQRSEEKMAPLQGKLRINPSFE
jgi:hypothetical protein